MDGGGQDGQITYSSGWWGQDGQTQHAVLDGEAEMVKHNMQQWMVGVKMVKQHAVVDGGAKMVKHNMQQWMERPRWSNTTCSSGWWGSRWSNNIQ